MARSVTEIYNQIIAEKASYTELNDLNSNSQTAIWRLFCYIIAAAINVFEQLQDVFKTEIEGIVLNNYIGTAKWIKTKCDEFQYNATTPQLLELNESNTKIGYATVNENLRIITRCAVATDINKIVNIKVAKSEPPTTLSAPEETALEAYLLELIPAGVNYNVVNVTSDKLYLAGTIYYDGQYSSTIQDAVELSINNYLANLDFNGSIKVVDIQIAIRNTLGVKDIDITDIWLRANSLPLANGFKMVDNGTLSIIALTPVSGYAIEETTASNTWADKLTYTIQ
jgi:hypothetical protein